MGHASLSRHWYEWGTREIMLVVEIQRGQPFSAQRKSCDGSDCGKPVRVCRGHASMAPGRRPGDWPREMPGAEIAMK